MMHPDSRASRPQCVLYGSCILFFILSFLLMGWLNQHIFSPVLAKSPDDNAPTFTVYLPYISTHAAAPSDRIWDPRLDQRGASFIPAKVTPGQGYWHLIKAIWFNSAESQGRHHIFVDTLDETGARQSGVPVLITWNGDATTIVTQAKPGEDYAADFPMFAIAPSYQAQPADNAAADSVDGMGLGDLDDPTHGIHTSYGLTWQWTIADAPAGTDISPTLTVTITPTLTVPATSAITATPSLTPTPTITATPTFTMTPMATPTPTPPPPYLFQRAEVTGCQPNNTGSWFEGYAKLAGQPVAGYRVVFSYEPDGPWVTQPVMTRAVPPGFYSHIISAGVARSGQWFAWLVDSESKRISPLASFTTDGPGGACNIVTVNFSGQ